MQGTEEILKVYIWVLTGALGLVVSVGILVISGLIKSLTERMDEMLKGINNLNTLTTQQNEQIKTLYNNKADTDFRLNDHGKRLRDLEIKCKNL